MRIGEVARQVGVATSAIRFYEGAGLLAEPERTPSGYREYEPAVIDRLAFIRAGQAVGLTLAQLKEVLRIQDRGEAPCQHVSELIGVRLREIDERMDELRRLRQELEVLAETADDFDPALCSTDTVCQILNANG